MYLRSIYGQVVRTSAFRTGNPGSKLNIVDFVRKLISWCCICGCDPSVHHCVWKLYHTLVQALWVKLGKSELFRRRRGLCWDEVTNYCDRVFELTGDEVKNYRESVFELPGDDAANWRFQGFELPGGEVITCCDRGFVLPEDKVTNCYDRGFELPGDAVKIIVNGDLNFLETMPQIVVSGDLNFLRTKSQIAVARDSRRNNRCSFRIIGSRQQIVPLEI